MDFALALHCLQNKDLKQEKNTEHMVIKLLFVPQVKLISQKDITAILIQTQNIT
jgi:hypothetical protein